MWIASRNAGGLTENCPNKLSWDGSSLSRPARISSRSRAATISATRGWRIPLSSTRSGPSLAEVESGELVRGESERRGFPDAQHLVAQRQPRRRCDAPVDLCALDVKVQLGEDGRGP